MASSFTALFDANVLYGQTLRSLIGYLAMQKLFRARWSAMIHDEWISSLQRNRPHLDRQGLECVRDLLDRAVPDALVTGYEPLIPRLDLPDQDDRHVLAAAIVGKASCIVTFNISDFPLTALEPFGLHAVHPDNFLLDVADLHPRLWLAAVKEDFQHYRNPRLTVDDYTERYVRAGLPQAAENIRALSDLLDGA